MASAWASAPSLASFNWARSPSSRLLKPAADLGHALGDLAAPGDLRLDVRLLLGQACHLLAQPRQLLLRPLQLRRGEAERAASVGQRGHNLLQLALLLRQLILHRARLILHLLQLVLGCRAVWPSIAAKRCSC